MGALKTWTSRVKGHMANSAMATSACSLKPMGACAMRSGSGLKVKTPRHHGETPSR